jgi:hypothetical protein
MKGGPKANKGRSAGDHGKCTWCQQGGHNISTCRSKLNGQPVAVAAQSDVSGVRNIGSYFGQGDAPVRGREVGEGAEDHAAARQDLDVQEPPVTQRGAFEILKEGQRQKQARDATAGASGGRGQAQGDEAQGDEDEDESENENEDEDEDNEDEDDHFQQYILQVKRRVLKYVEMNQKWPWDILLDKPLSPWVYPPDHRMLRLETGPERCHLPVLFLWYPWYWAKTECGAMPNCPGCGGIKIHLSQS